MDTAAAAASATTNRPSFNFQFIASPVGWFKLLEFILGLLVWPLIASVNHYWNEGGLVYVMFVSVTCWVVTTILIIIYIMALHSTILSGVPWDVFEFFHNLLWSVMYLTAAIVEAVFTHDLGVLKASTTFAFFLTVVFLANTLYAFKSWRGSVPFTSSGNTGSQVNK